MALLRACTGLPKLNFLLRACPPWQLKNAAHRLDLIQRAAVGEILAHHLPRDAQQQVSLPIRQGGFGICSAVAMSHPAYIASVVQSLDLQQSLLRGAVAAPRESFNRALDELNQSRDIQMTVSVLKHFTNIQRALSSYEHEKTFKHLFEKGSTRDKARLNACTMRHSGDWLTAVPSSYHGTVMAPREFRTAAWYRLGMQVYADVRQCPVCRNGFLDALGDHAVTCAGTGDRTGRHNAMRDLVFTLATRAGYAAQTEVKHLLDNTGEKPADVYLSIWKEG
jgi:hypothetical protein